MTCPLRATGGAGILLAIGAARLGFVWLAAIGAALCVVFLVAFVRGLLVG